MGLGRHLPKEADVRTCLAQEPVPTVDWWNVARVTIDMLPDLALLEMFHFYVAEERITYEERMKNEEQINYKEQIDAWHALVHVCQRWRIVVFGSPHRLGLRLRCSARTSMREMLDVWPPLPIAILGEYDEKWALANILAALEHNDRICQLELFHVPSLQMERIFAAMQQPFLALACLDLKPTMVDWTTPIIPASFLGGSAPGLRALRLNSISFPGLPKLLLSATHLVYLDLRGIPRSWCISPDAMVTSLSVLTRLKILNIGFEYPPIRPNQESRRPPTRTLLPVLTNLWFCGASEYIEDFVARINAPLLDNLTMLFDQLILNIPQFAEFISCTPKFKGHDEARVIFYSVHISVILPQTSDGTLELAILRRRSDWQVSSLAQICNFSFRQALLTVEHLYIQVGFPPPYVVDDIERSHWLELLHPYTAVKELYLSQKLAPSIAPVLQELVGERVTEVLPALQALFLEEPLPSGPVQEAIGQFVTARQLAGYPITVSCWKGVESV